MSPRTALTGRTKPSTPLRTLESTATAAHVQCCRRSTVFVCMNDEKKVIGEKRGIPSYRSPRTLSPVCDTLL